MFQLVKMPGNVLPNPSDYPLLTMALFMLMGSLVSPLAEEAGLRGYCQVILEREFRGPIAVVISSVFFAFGHVNHGLLWPKLSVYFLAGLAFGTSAYLTKSILPGIPVHMLGDLTFFALVWPYDTSRRLVWEGGGDAWFWIHVAQAVVFTVLAIMAYCKLAGLAAQDRMASELAPTRLVSVRHSAVNVYLDGRRIDILSRSPLAGRGVQHAQAGCGNRGPKRQRFRRRGSPGSGRAHHRESGRSAFVSEGSAAVR